MTLLAFYIGRICQDVIIYLGRNVSTNTHYPSPINPISFVSLFSVIVGGNGLIDIT